MAAVEAAQKREDAEWQCEPVDPEAVAAAKAEALAAGSTLGDDGRIACPEALCRALGLSRSTYQHVISQYADGGPRDRDRPGDWRRARSAWRVGPAPIRCCAP